MQRGHVYKAHGAWHLRYRLNGKQVSVKLADYNDEYRTLKSVRPLAEPYLQTANSDRQADGATFTLQQFAETIYLPYAKANLKPSTYKGYFNLYTKQIQPRIGGLRLLTCATHDIQRVLWTINEEEELSHQSFLNINSMLSAIFTHARRRGTLAGPNPTDGVDIPEGKRTGKTHKYTLAEVEKITNAVSGVARCSVVVAAWTGLSLAELRGLKWEDIDWEKKQLNVVRTVWHREIIDTKTEHRAAAVHLLPNVIAELKRHRKENPHTKWVFEGPRVFPLDLATLGSKQIKKALKGTGADWYGFHAFRRGLGTRLYNNGVPLDLVGKILRHGSESEVTLKSYIDVEEKTKAAALQGLPRKEARR